MIVSVSSVAGKMGTPMRSGYCAAKHAIIGFMDALRAEMVHNNISVLVITPGSIQTNVSINALEGDGKNHNVIDPMIAKGIPVDVCARKIINGIKNERKEIIVANAREKLAVYLKRFTPNLLFKIIAKSQTT